MNGSGCRKCSYDDSKKRYTGVKKINKLDTETIINRLKKIYNYDYSKCEIEGSRNNAIIKNIICPTHGFFNKRLNNHLRLNQGCNICGSNKSNIKEFIEKTLTTERTVKDRSIKSVPWVWVLLSKNEFFNNTYVPALASMNDYKKKGVAKYKPLSRAYYKMLEMIHSFYLISNYEGPIKCFHLAEGPGGFIEALLKTRKCSSDMYVGMTLLDDNNDDNIPAWKKSQHFLRENPNVSLEYGKDGTGNILSLENLDYCREKYGSSMDIITGDGGFDFSDDYSNQENNIIKLLFAQIVFALTMQMLILDGEHQIKYKS
jgi:23S rRNA U2552 (ribose-2'-O)-methylase RlmE/FtsJ